MRVHGGVHQGVGDVNTYRGTGDETSRFLFHFHAFFLWHS